MLETRKEITGYEGLYEMTVSGRIFSIKRQRFLARCNDEYGFHIVKLYKNGGNKNHNVYKLWEMVFENESVSKSEFKGAVKAKY